MVEKDALSFPNIISGRLHRRCQHQIQRLPLLLSADASGSQSRHDEHQHDKLHHAYKYVQIQEGGVLWISAVIFTLATTEYMLSRATRARIPLNTMMISASLKLLELTVVSLYIPDSFSCTNTAFSTSWSVICINKDSRLPGLTDKTVHHHFRIHQLLKQNRLILPYPRRTGP